MLIVKRSIYNHRKSYTVSGPQDDTTPSNWQASTTCIIPYDMQYDLCYMIKLQPYGTTCFNTVLVEIKDVRIYNRHWKWKKFRQNSPVKWRLRRYVIPIYKRILYLYTPSSNYCHKYWLRLLRFDLVEW